MSAAFSPVLLHEGPLPNDGPAFATGCGAVLTFEGVVRPSEPDGEAVRPLAALRYEAYEPMTTRELDRLRAACAAEFGATLAVEHSVGVVPVGACSFRLRVATPHRAAALACCGAFVDRMKRDVPLWKVPVWA
ncbi:molybdopterin synthase catalytic subunit [Alienimonas californiensis]|uniref:Molybdopterin synthase catalytic subunit n=1 Tax=Alienimonas californiensis TaxID=2527989 RepID=A0A517PDK4_9PLAN|nr:molybdenum cofactor biosynthesis protein MoaE [Alienimonas californiensis]QDT17439.1 Molybdopterin synthase catalytic subunit [Alienimonas californiensis]